MTVSDTSSPESVKATPAVIPIVAIFAGVSAAVGAINGVIDLVTKIQSARSVVVEVDNNTDLLLTRTGDNLVHGGYAKDPDHEIAPHAPLVFGGVSRGLFTGTEGYVDWAAGPVTFRIHWDCPYVGTNSANVQVLGPDAGHYQAFVTAGAGNTAAQMKFELFRSGADFVSQTPPPATLNPGQTVQVAVTMKNTSIHPWTSASAFALGSQNPQDNTQWGSGRIGLAHDVAPGEQVTFTFPLTAPTSAGYFNFSWRMVQDGVAWFGDYTPTVRVKVGNPKTKESKEKDHHNKEAMFNKDINDTFDHFPLARVPQGVIATAENDTTRQREDATTFIGADERS